MPILKLVVTLSKKTHKDEDTQQKTMEQSAAVEATTQNKKTFKVKATFEGTG